jgi:hypothetical protein
MWAAVLAAATRTWRHAHDTVRLHKQLPTAFDAAVNPLTRLGEHTINYCEPISIFLK